MTFDIKKALGKIIVGALSTLVVLGANSPDFFARVFMPESLMQAAGIGVVIEVLDYIIHLVKRNV